jgi:hypothetical protein
VRTTEELRARHAELLAALEVLAAVDGDLDETQRSDWDAGMTEAEAIAKEIEEREARAARFKELARSRSAAAPADGGAAVHAATGDGAEGAEARRADFQVVTGKPSVDEIFDRSQLRTGRDEDGVAFRDKAMRSLETWDKHIKPSYRESATRMLERCDSSVEGRRISDHILETSRPEYVRAFNNFIRGGTLGLEPA